MVAAVALGHAVGVVQQRRVAQRVARRPLLLARGRVQLVEASGVCVEAAIGGNKRPKHDARLGGVEHELGIDSALAGGAVRVNGVPPFPLRSAEHDGGGVVAGNFTGEVAGVEGLAVGLTGSGRRVGDGVRNGARVHRERSFQGIGINPSQEIGLR